jgi:uncharacterized protein YbjT (DUF2867 family)
MFQIAVIGGTGLIGSKVVTELRKRGHEAIAAAPSTGVDTITGEGLDDVLASTEIVIDLSNSPSFDDQPAMDFFMTAGRNIAEAEARAGVRHHVALSVVGIEQMQGSGYFRAKLAQERLVAGGSVPYTIVRATQFFEFLRAIANFSTVDGVVRLPPVGFQPMAAADIALAVVEAALGNPQNGVVEIGGPEMFTLDEPVRQVLAADGDARNVVADPTAVYFGIDVDQATLVPGLSAQLGATTLKWWIDHVPPPPAQ